MCWRRQIKRSTWLDFFFFACHFCLFFTFISSSLSTTNNLTLCFESSTIFLACQRATIDRNVEKRRNEMSHFCGFFQQVIILSVAADDSTHRLRNSNYVIHLLLLQARAFESIFHLTALVYDKSGIGCCWASQELAQRDFLHFTIIQ